MGSVYHIMRKNATFAHLELRQYNEWSSRKKLVFSPSGAIPRTWNEKKSFL